MFNSRSENNFIKQIKDKPNSIKVLTEGDSWFSHPFVNTIPQYLALKKDISLLRLEHMGDELISILSGASRVRLISMLEKYDFDFLLLSGGGNDMIDGLSYSLNSSAKEIEDYFCESYFDRLLCVNFVLNDFLQEMAVKFPKCKVIIHGYDYIIPSDFPSRFLFILPFGPWVYPVLMKIGITNSDVQEGIAKFLIDTLNRGYEDLAESHDNLYYMDFRGKVDEWFDEIHPSAEVANELANLYYERILGLRA